MLIAVKSLRQKFAALPPPPKSHSACDGYCEPFPAASFPFLRGRNLARYACPRATRQKQLYFKVGWAAAEFMQFGFALEVSAIMARVFGVMETECGIMRISTENAT